MKAKKAKSFAKKLINSVFHTAEEPKSKDNMDDQDKKNIPPQEEEPSFEDIFTGKTEPPKNEPAPKAKEPGQKTKFDEFSEEFSKAAGEAGQKAAEISERVGKKVLEASDKINERLFDEGEKLWDKAKEKGSSILDRFEELADKATEEAKKVSFDDLTQKAKEMNEALERRVKERGQRSNAENLERDRKKGPLGGMDSFFSKAERFASGDYSGDEDAGKKMIIRKDPDYKPKENTGKVKGFEDLDGDGDELIDDAIIDGDDK